MDRYRLWVAGERKILTLHLQQFLHLRDHAEILLQVFPVGQETKGMNSRGYLCIQEKPTSVPHPLRSFHNVAFKIVPMVVWSMMVLFSPFREDCPVLPLFTPLSSRQINGVTQSPWNFWDTNHLVVMAALPASLTGPCKRVSFHPLCPLRWMAECWPRQLKQAYTLH